LAVKEISHQTLISKKCLNFRLTPAIIASQAETARIWNFALLFVKAGGAGHAATNERFWDHII
jgi:hypothetical protein